MSDEARVYGNRWRVVRDLGKGGQGIVYEVREVPDFDVSLEARKLQQALRQSVSVSTDEAQRRALTEIVDAIRRLSTSDTGRVGALKELLPIDQAVNAKTALERMRIELETLRSVHHSSLIKVLDDRLEERWFVTEYLSDGTLADHLDTYKGRVLEALRAFRPIVDAVAALHRANVVHRDVKPANVFIGHDKLVLGDCGLAFKMEHQDRLTLTYENVGTRDYMPVWAYSMRLDQVKPTFDVYSLGKLLWAMVSGRPGFPIWRFDEDPHDLRTLFPDQPEMKFVHAILKKTVVSRESECKLLDAGALLVEVDGLVEALEAGAQVPSKARSMRCRFCGVGHYEEQNQFRRDGFGNPSDRRYYYRCDNCGHVESFFWHRDLPPPAWE